MQDILDMLVQEIEEGAFPYFCAKREYRRNRQSALEHFQWLEEHLSGPDRSCHRNASGPPTVTKTPLSPNGDKGANLCGTTPIP